MENQINNLSGKEWLQNSFSIWRDLGKTDEEKKLKHPAIFTLKLVDRLIDTFCRPDGKIVLDCFAGSGTTLISGLRKGKDVIGFDLSQEYKDVFLNRSIDSYGFKQKDVESKYVIADSRFLSEKVRQLKISLYRSI